MKVAIIGGGSSGLFCATQLNKKIQVTIFEKNESLGKKLLITGNGRCNVTNLKTPHNFLNNVPVNSKFLYSAINAFSPQSMVDFLQFGNIELIEENDNKIFPKNSKSKTILNYLISNLNENVTILYNSKVTNIEKQSNQFLITANEQTYTFDKVIIATGGLSYAITGSSGDGYIFAKNFGHNVTHLRQSLCGLITDNKVFKNASGVAFNLKATIKDENNKTICTSTGDAIVTHFGISGPAIYKLTSLYLENEIKGKFLELDFIPHLNENELLNELENYINNNSKEIVFNFIQQFFVKRFAYILLNEYNNLLNIKCNQVSKQKRQELVNLLKHFKLQIYDFDSFEGAIVTRGGVDVKEINNKTMESKIVTGLYFIGEILNVDALTGGYNLQIAFSTAYSCANHINSLGEI